MFTKVKLFWKKIKKSVDKMKTYMYNVHKEITKREVNEKLIVVKEPQLLKQALTSDGRTMTSVAQKLGYSKAYISSIVAGTRNPNEKVAIGICELLKKQFEEFFYIRSVHKNITK